MNKPIRMILENQVLIMWALSRLMSTGNGLEVDAAKKLQDKYIETRNYLKEN